MATSISIPLSPAEIAGADGVTSSTLSTAREQNGDGHGSTTPPGADQSMLSSAISSGMPTFLHTTGVSNPSVYIWNSGEEIFDGRRETTRSYLLRCVCSTCFSLIDKCEASVQDTRSGSYGVAITPHMTRAGARCVRRKVLQSWPAVSSNSSD